MVAGSRVKRVPCWLREVRSQQTLCTSRMAFVAPINTLTHSEGDDSESWDTPNCCLRPPLHGLSVCHLFVRIRYRAAIKPREWAQIYRTKVLVDTFVSVGDKRLHTLIFINTSDNDANVLAQHAILRLLGRLPAYRREILEEAGTPRLSG
jgi:hypothetical protein